MAQGIQSTQCADFLLKAFKVRPNECVRNNTARAAHTFLLLAGSFFKLLSVSAACLPAEAMLAACSAALAACMPRQRMTSQMHPALICACQRLAEVGATWLAARC